MKKIKITNYMVENETKINNDVIELDYDETKWGDDLDVEDAWIKDEINNMFGVNLSSYQKVA